MSAQHRILIVDDDETIRDTLVDFLDDHGYQAVGAVHGRDALEKLRGADPLPCLIVLDLMMPIMDGATFRQHQLRDPALSGIPVTVMSAYRDMLPRLEGMNIDAYLKKPLQLDDLLRIVRHHCPAK